MFVVHKTAALSTGLVVSMELRQRQEAETFVLYSLLTVIEAKTHSWSTVGIYSMLPVTHSYIFSPVSVKKKDISLQPVRLRGIA